VAEGLRAEQGQDERSGNPDGERVRLNGRKDQAQLHPSSDHSSRHASTARAPLQSLPRFGKACIARGDWILRAGEYVGVASHSWETEACPRRTEYTDCRNATLARDILKESNIVPESDRSSRMHANANGIEQA